MSPVALIVLAALLVPLAGLFAAADAALNSVSRARVETLVREGRTGARALAAIVADRPRHVNLLLLLRLVAETAATVLLTVALARMITPVWAGILTAGAIMVVVSYVLIGVGPRTLGRQHPYELGIAIAAPVRALATLLGPLTKLLILIGNAVTPGKGFRQGPFSSEVELRELVDMASTSGVVDETERKMIHSVFELGDTLVREVMVPRPDVVWVERDTTVDKVLRLALRSGYSRLPVLGENIDDVIGVAYLKDLVRAQNDQTQSEQTGHDDPEAVLTAVMRPAVYVPDSKRIDELLKEMQRTRNHMAIVVDEYGGTAGVVTIEDILEEIVGEITDEYDAEEVPEVARLDDGRLRVAARLPVEDLQELDGLFPEEPFPESRDYDEGPAAELRAVLEEADVDTVGGLLAQQLGRVPLPGSEVEVAGLHLLAEGGKDARGRVRITTVLITPAHEESESPYREPGSGERSERGVECSGCTERRVGSSGPEPSRERHAVPAPGAPMTTPRFDVVVVGGGIVGLATAHAVARTGRSVAVVEREPRLAAHQTGNNSNVIHSGLYYAPGGYKARLAVAGCAETVAFCRAHDLPHEVTGKLVVATEPEELPRLAELKRRGDANGVENHELDPTGMRAHEPHVRGIKALFVPSTGITDYRAIAEKLGELVQKDGGEIHLGRAVRSVVRRRADVVVRTDGGDLLGTQVVVCAGLRCDELARASGADPGVRIIPFRGEYSGFGERAAGLVKGLIYPVPDPAFPFLGVHATRGIDGSVHAGPNAVLALAREGYSWGVVKPKELIGSLAYPGMLHLARQHWRYGLGEMHRSLSRAAMVRQIQRLLPDVRADDLHPAGAGVRAQAVRADGTLVDDFLFVAQGSGAGAVLHVLNAPSPAATAALPIGREILETLTGEKLGPL